MTKLEALTDLHQQALEAAREEGPGAFLSPRAGAATKHQRDPPDALILAGGDRDTKPAGA